MLANYILTLVWGWMGIFHPFYISLTEMRYNPDSQRIEVSQKIFWDDLEEALTAASGQQVNFLNPADPELLNALVQRYLLKHNRLSVDGKPLELQYLGFEVEEDAAWFYLESGKVKKPRELTVENELLLEHFPGQQNIIHVYFGNKPKTLMLDKRRRMGKVEVRN